MAEVSPNELRDLTDIAFRIVNRLLGARGMQEQFVWRPAFYDTEALLRTLTKHPRDDGGDTSAALTIP